MIDRKQQIKLQAYLDGELLESEQREVAAWLAGNPEAAALVEEFKNTQQALTGFEQGIKLPESREFFWSKIEREINRGERTEPAPVEQGSLFTWLRRLLVPSVGLAIAVIAVMLAWPRAASAGPELETTMADSGAFTYRDEQAGMTVVWFSYGSENGLANSSEAGTIQQQ